MREAAADLEFEKAARLRDEIKRLSATELAIADDPFARQSRWRMPPMPRCAAAAATSAAVTARARSLLLLRTPTRNSLPLPNAAGDSPPPAERPKGRSPTMRGGAGGGGQPASNYTADAIDDAFLRAVRDGNATEGDGKASRGKGSRMRMKRAGRPNVPKTFGSRSR